MQLEGKKVLVTGAEGFIGSHLVERLYKSGANVRAMVQYNSWGSWGWIDTFDEEIKNGIEIYMGDVRESDSVSRAVEGMDAVFHLAALIAIPYSYKSPAAYVRTNVEGTLNILEACRVKGIERVIHTSTSEVYGSAQYVPIDEIHPLKGQSPYSASKIGADKMAESYYCSFSLPVTTVRPFNTYGPRQSARAIIPTIISQVLGGSKIIKLGSLEPTRDFNYVLDTVDGFVKASVCDEAVGQVVNVGRGYEISMGDLAAKIASLIDKDVQVVRDDERVRPEKSEVERLMCNNEKARKLIGWAPSYSLEEGLMSTIEWFSKNLDKYKTSIYNI